MTIFASNKKMSSQSQPRLKLSSLTFTKRNLKIRNMIQKTLKKYYKSIAFQNKLCTFCAFYFSKKLHDYVFFNLFVYKGMTIKTELFVKRITYLSLKKSFAILKKIMEHEFNFFKVQKAQKEREFNCSCKFMTLTTHDFHFC